MWIIEPIYKFTLHKYILTTKFNIGIVFIYIDYKTFSLVLNYVNIKFKLNDNSNITTNNIVFKYIKY